MGLESGNYIYDLVQANPPAGDQRKEGDDHIRLIKKALQQTFPHVTGPYLPTSTGTAANQAITHTFGPASYIQGMIVAWVAGFNSNGPMTLAVNGLGAKNVYMAGSPISAGNIVQGSLVVAIYDGVQFQIFGSAGIGGYLPITGGTLTGSLNVQGAITAASTITINGSVGLVIDNAVGKSVSGRTSGNNRWVLALGSGGAESGGGAGSDFALYRYTDGGILIDAPIAITRSSGTVNFGPGSNLNAAGNTITAQAFQADGVAGTFRQVGWRTSTVNRWLFQCDNVAEGGANAGSNFSLSAFADGGGLLGSVFSSVRSTQVVTFTKTIVNGPSDRRLKENIRPLEGALEKVLALRGVSFNFLKDKKKREIGLIAQDVEPIVPEVLQDYNLPDEEPMLAIDYTRLVPVLIEAIKELTARIANLEEKADAQGHESR